MKPFESRTAGQNHGSDSEQRVSRRLRVLKGAKLGFGEQFAGLTCVVVDLSEVGAKIRLNDFVALPQRMSLHIEVDETKVDCELVWYRPPFAGLRFTGQTRRSAIGRRQTLGSAETALSERFRREYALREKMAHLDNSTSTNETRERETSGSTLGPARKVASNAFGKRKFRGV